MQNQIKEISLSKYPRVFNIETPFWEDLYKHYSGEIKGINRGEYNLICSKRDVSLYAKTSMKPHARWKVSDVKKYFNIKGTKESLLADFMEVWGEYQDMKNEFENAQKKGYQIQLTD